MAKQKAEEGTTVAKVNAAIRAMGRTEKLTRGAGYYYWRDGDGIFWASIYVYRIADMTLTEVMEEVEENIEKRSPAPALPKGEAFEAAGLVFEARR